MNNMLCTSLCAAFCLGGVAFAETFDLEKEVKGLLRADRDISTGTAEETGTFILSLSEIISDGSQTRGEAIEFATLKGKRALSGFLGQQVSGSDEVVTEMVTPDGGEAAIREQFKTSVRMDIHQFLRGACVVQTVKRGATEYIVLLATEKQANAAETLRNAIDSGGGPNTVHATGLAGYQDGKTDVAREAALNRAQASAVEQVLGTLVASTGASTEDKVFAKVFANSAGCIKRFRIETEGNFGANTYRVNILAEVAKDELLQSYRSILAAMGDITFHVRCDNLLVTDLVAEQFAGWGCSMSTDPVGATYLILCEPTFSAASHPADGRDGTRLSLSVRIVDPNTNEELLTVMNDPRKATTFTGDERRQQSLAVGMAMKELHGKTHQKLQQLVGRMATSGRKIVIRFNNYSGAHRDVLDLYAACIRKMPGCGEPTSSIQNAERTAVLSVTCQTDIDVFRALLNDRVKKDFQGDGLLPDETDVSANGLTLSW